MSLTRRRLLGATAAAAAASFAPRSLAAPAPANVTGFTYCLNTATIRGQKLGIVKEIEVAGKAGYTGIEPWISSISEYVNAGGALKDLRNRLGDAGLSVEGAIGFTQWIIDDDAKRAAAMEQMKRDMDMLAQIGAKRIAAPPAGATRNVTLDLDQVAIRYRALCELGDEMNITPELEIWGSSENMCRLSQAAYVVMECAHPRACILPDVYHLYRGGSSFGGLRLLSGDAIQAFHMNDYPAGPPRESLKDSDRVYPGDGIAPLGDILRALHGTGGSKVLSLEVFNAAYWAEDALETARTGLAKMQEAVAKALA